MADSPDSRDYSNPVRLSVATRDPKLAGQEAGPSNYSEKERLLRGRNRNEEIRRKGDKWADKMMEETLDRETFKRGVRWAPYIQPYLSL